jgi:Aspartyl protease
MTGHASRIVHNSGVWSSAIDEEIPMRNTAVAFAVLAAALSFVGETGGQGVIDTALQIPFSFEHNEIIVQAAIGQKGPYAMLLDTDTNPSVVSLALARSSGLALRKIGGQISGGGADRPDVYLTKLPRVGLHGSSPKDLQAIALDLEQMSSRLGTTIDGVLGHNFLSGNVVEIDYPNRLVRIGKRPTSALPVVASLPFRYDDDSSSLVVDGAMVNGKKVSATIDTGSDGTFKLTPAAVDALGLTEAARNGTPDASVGYKGITQNTLGRIEEIVLGDIGLHSVEVVFFAKGTGRDQKPWGVNIGNGFLRDYIVTVDYPRKLITLQRP